MMKRNTLASIFAAMGLGMSGGTSVAQGISDDVVRIGFLTDMSGIYSTQDGPGGLEAVRMAIEEMGGAINGKKIELVFADHQHRADVASARAREWFDRDKVDMIVGGVNSATMLATSAVAAEKKKPVIVIGAGASNLHNQDCTPYTIHYAYDTTGLARGTASAVVRDGGKSWFFLTADYAFGYTLEREATESIQKAGGRVVGSVRAPLNTADFSSFLLQAQSSGADVIGLANAGGDTINSIRAAAEFGITQTTSLAGLLMFITDIHTLGLDVAQGMYLTTGWYWDLSEASRQWSARFEAKMGHKPTMLQAGDYSAALFYLKAVAATGTDDADTVMAWMKSNPVNDMFATGGRVRPDGAMVHDMYLMQVKTPAQSKGPWDYFNLVQTIPGDDINLTREESLCPLWK